MENTATKKTAKHTCEFCKSEINNSLTNKYCNRICKRLAYLERKSLQLLEEKEFNDLEKALNAIGLRVIKGGKYRSEEIEKRAAQFLIFCQSLFWADRNFSEAEQEEFKFMIRTHFFTEQGSIDQIFLNLIERAVLAKKYISYNPMRFIAEPKKWFDINYAYGLTGTGSWFNELQEQRAEIPFYKIGITILAEAVLEYFDKRNILNIPAYRDQFLKLREYDLLQMYMNAVIHIQFLNFLN